MALLVACLCSPVASALDEQDTGTFLAVDEQAEPLGKVFRVSIEDGRWKFEDRQPDGAWLDVSCHGGCDHLPARPEDLVSWFGAPPPDSIRPECIRNTEFAFCRFHTAQAEHDGYVLVVRINSEWLPITLVRLPEGAEPKPEPLEAT